MKNIIIFIVISLIAFGMMAREKENFFLLMSGECANDAKGELCAIHGGTQTLDTSIGGDTGAETKLASKIGSIALMYLDVGDIKKGTFNLECNISFGVHM